MYNVISVKNNFFTLNMNPGHSVYSEQLIHLGKKEYRKWDPKRSKLCAAMKKGIKIDIAKDSNLLYLGAASGTTVSHLSDILVDGRIFAVEFSPEVFRELYFLADKRRNIFPILADANQPLKYYFRVNACDIVYQDIAQRNQLEIFEKNIKLYLKKQGFGVLCVKARSIDVTEKPKKIFDIVKQELKKRFKLEDFRNLDPYQKDHMMFVVRNR